MRVLGDNTSQAVITPKDRPSVSPALDNLTARSVAQEPVAHSEHGTDWAKKDRNQQRGGVAHDAAAIVASMSAMKTQEEVVALFDAVYNHILSRVMED